MARFANESARITNALTPTNRDLLNHIRNAEMAAGLRLKWEGREEVIQAWRNGFMLEMAEWMKKGTDTHLSTKEIVYVFLNLAQFVQETILEEEKS